ncbi:MAG: ABC transporter substrate-binding protein [Desulfobacterales bacterium]|nr:ABC transporter substrate-binding protein [Desulfobacterales bacterium]
MKYKFKPICYLIIISFFTGYFILPKTSNASEPIIIGVLHWEGYPYAAMMKNSFEMALEVVNKNGGIKGRNLKLVYADDQGTREPGEKAVKYLVNKAGAVMLTGGYASSNTLYTARASDNSDTPFLICTAADDRITQRKMKNVYRLNPPASEYTKGLEDFFIKSVKPKSMAIIYENSPYGTGSALRMMWFCREKDIEIRAIIPYHKERIKNEITASGYFHKLVSPLKADAPDVIYMVSYLKDGAMLVRTIRELNIKSLLCGGAGGFTHQKFITAAGEAGKNLLTATLWFHKMQYPGIREYYNQYVEKYSAPPDYHGAEAYTAVFVAAEALNRAESFSPGSIRNALNKTDFKTPFGPVKFKSYGKFERQNSLPTMVLQVINGKFECVWPKK